MSTLVEKLAATTIAIGVITTLGINFNKASNQVDKLANMTIETANNNCNPVAMELARLEAERQALIAKRQAEQGR